MNPLIVFLIFIPLFACWIILASNYDPTKSDKYRIKNLEERVSKMEELFYGEAQ